MADPTMEDTSPLNKFKANTAATADSMGILQTLRGGAVATVVDAGVTLFNSITPEKFNASTHDLLSRLNNNALQVYNEHTDAVQTASFVAGLAAPIGLSIKGMNLLRSGAKGVNWFTDAGRTANLQKVDEAYKAAGPVSAEFKFAKNKLYAAMVGNAVADNIVAETAILMTLNAHPMMEDYQKDIGQNFLISVALGGAIQAGVGKLTTASTINKMTGATDREFTNIASRVFGQTSVNEVEHIGVQLAQRGQRVDNLKAYMDAAADPKSPLQLSPITLAGLEVLHRQEQARMVKTFLDASSDDIKALDVATRDSVLARVKQTDFAGMNTIKFAGVNFDQAAQLDRNPLKGLKPSMPFWKSTTNKKTGDVKVNPRDAIYSPVHQAWFSVKEGVDYLTIADLGVTIQNLERTVDKSIGKVARPDQSLVNMTAHSAVVEQDFAQSLIGIGKMSVDDLSRLVVASDDLSVLKAVEARFMSLRLEGVDVSKVNVKLTREAPSSHVLEAKALRMGGVAPGSLQEMRKISTTNWDKYTVGKVDYDGLKNADTLEAVRLSANSQKLRDTLTRFSDGDGYVYLYKASTKGAGFGVYRLSPEGFGAAASGAKLYKVHTDDVIGSLSKAKSPEILVKQAVQTTDEFLERTAIPLLPTTPVGSVLTNTAVDYRTIGAHLAEVNGTEIKSMASLGLGVEAIAARTGTPVEAVRAFIAGEDVGASFTRFTSVHDIEEAIKPINRALQVSANVDKVPTAAMMANLNAKNMDSISQGVIEYLLKTSPSAFVRRVADDLTTDEVQAQIHFLKEGLDDILPSSVKSTFFRSADSVLEDLGANGQYATALGKQRINAGNRIIDNITKPMSTVFSAIAGDVAKTIELNTAININAAQKGYRFYRDGKFWQLGEGVPSKIGIDEIAAMDDQAFAGLVAFKDAKTGMPALSSVMFKGKEYSIVSPEVREAMEIMQNAGRDMYHLANAYHNGVGRGALNDIGLWIPSHNVRDKQVAYAFNKVTQETTMLLAKTPEELNSGIRSYSAAQGEGMRNIDIVTKDQQEAYNMIAGRHDPMYMSVADLSKQHSGASASALVSTGTDVMTDVIRSYDTYINRHIDNVFQLQLAPILEHLKNLSDVSQKGFDASTLGAIGKFTKKPVDPGQVIANVIMGKPNLNQHAAWGEWQQRGQVFTDLALKTMTEILSPILLPVTKGLSSTRKAEDWAKITRQMEDKGIVNPFQVLDHATGTFKVSKALGEEQFVKQGQLSGESLTPRTIALGNALAATTLLRFAELAQPLVNILSLPILTTAAVRRQFAKSLAGTDLTSNPVFTTGATMMDGIRLMNHPTLAKKWDDLANAASLYGRDWQEVNGIMAQSRKLDPGPITALESALESKLVTFMSKPADMSEGLVRRTSFFNGVILAKRAYPGISDAGVMTFARDFMDKAIGNYTAAQRPAMFQGTFGMGLGLFQTYMLTLAQSMFRQVEQKQFASLGKMMLAQATVFGAGSLPGFNMVSQAIGDHFSDQNVDLKTGTFRAIGDTGASLVLYGLPSQLVGINTRGDIQPRIPDPFSGLNSVAAVNLTGQMFSAGHRLAKAAFSADENTGKAMLEALSLQSVSRPLARLSELASGVSVTGRGNVVSKDAEMYTIQSIASRVLATRPLEEIKTREAMHLNTLYGSLDRAKRQDITHQLKSHIRNGDLTDEKVSHLANEYMRTGSPTGWRSSVNTALAQVRNPGSTTVRNSLDPNSPTNLMIDDLDGD